MMLTKPGEVAMIEMTIDSIRMSLMNYQRVVILKEKAADHLNNRL
jgi:hypothetical protein